MKLLTVETRQYLTYYHSRYQHVLDLGVDLFALNGEGTADFWPADRYRLVGSKRIDEMIAVAKEWHAVELLGRLEDRGQRSRLEPFEQGGDGRGPRRSLEQPDLAKDVSGPEHAKRHRRAVA